MIADDLLSSGDLAGARAALVETIKRAPEDGRARMFLWQVMAVQGDWDKAAVQLRSLASVAGETQMLATVYSQAIAAEKQRAEAYGGRAPLPVLVSSSPWIDTLAQGLAALARGEAEEGAHLRDEAFDAAGDTPGEIDGHRFGWIADVDPRLGPCFEAVAAGRWGLIPFEAVSHIKTEGPRDLRDVVWLPVELTLRSGQSAAALLPARYPGAETAADSLKLGRSTEWQDDVPFGQRTWATDDGGERGLLEFREIVMA